MKNPEIHEPTKTIESGSPVAQAESAFLAKKKKSQKCGLEKKRKNAFHGEGLSDHSTGSSRELRPVSAELKFHRDSRYDSNQKINGEYLRPEAGGFVVALVLVPKSDRS